MSKCGTLSVKVRKEGEKDFWIEVWTPSLNGGLRQSLKISGEAAKIYNDTVFGGFNWSKDLTKVCFVGEAPEPASYKNPWDEQPKKAEEQSKADAPVKPIPKEYFQDEKFLYKEDFGEGMVGKRTPTIFVYDLVQNTISRVYGLAADLLPMYPIFDEQSKGIIFSAVNLQTKKLGLVYCLNRPTGLYYIKAPICDKD